MARRLPDERLAQLVETATKVFIEQGYHRTHMADVAGTRAREGTLYLYVKSKEALFDLVIPHADDEDAAQDETAEATVVHFVAAALTKEDNS